MVDRFDFAADGDLYSWIVKDIVVNHHFRLIGQLTSAPGIFVGPLFYYFLVPFFILTNMDPIGALIPITILGLVTVYSYYFVLSRLFKKEVGLIAAFLYSVLLVTVSSDRWVVPTVTTSIWAIWYLYTLIMLSRGNFSVFPLLGILIGLIWHIHIALAPTLLAVPVALFFAKKIPKLKEIFLFLLAMFLFSLPLIGFELRHNFLQTRSLVSNFSDNFSGKNNIFEIRQILLGGKNNNGRINLESSTKLIVDVTPETANPGDNIRIKVITKIPIDTKTTIYTDCGSPRKYEIGDVAAGFLWSSKNCTVGEHQIKIEVKEIKNSFWARTTDKFLSIVEKENRNINSLILAPINIRLLFQYIITFITLVLPFFVWRFNLFTSQQIAIFYSWIVGLIFFFSLSSIAVSEYYLASIYVIIITTFSLILSKLYDKKIAGKIFVFCLLVFVGIKSLGYFVTEEVYHKGYNERKSTVDYIVQDASKKSFACFGINFITKPGENFGFNYFFYLSGAKIIKPSISVPVYSIVLPDELAKNTIDQKYGHIGIITPTQEFNPKNLEKDCDKIENIDFSASMPGYAQ